MFCHPNFHIGQHFFAVGLFFQIQRAASMLDEIESKTMHNDEEGD